MIVIDAQKLSASRPNRPLFTDISLTLSEGDRIGIVGLNGCGKSTLLRILSGEYSPDNGVVHRGRVDRDAGAHDGGAGEAGRFEVARDRHADVFGMQHAERRLAQRLGDGELVHLFVITLLQIDDFAFARAADQNHRKAVGSRVSQRGQTIQKSGCGHRQTNARFLRHETCNRRRVAGVLLMTERNHAHAGSLRLPRKIRNWNSGQPVDGVDAVKLERVDDEVKTVGRFLRCSRRRGRSRGLLHRLIDQRDRRNLFGKAQRPRHDAPSGTLLPDRAELLASQGLGRVWAVDADVQECEGVGGLRLLIVPTLPRGNAYGV